MSTVLFADRADAGRRLGRAVATRSLGSPIVLCLPRGGVPVGVEVARALRASMDVLITRKVGAPQNPELAAAVVVEGEAGHITLNAPVLRRFGLDADDIAEDVARERREILRRAAIYRAGRKRASVGGRDVVLVDDGIATGTSVRAAIEALRPEDPTSIGVAVPVAAPEALAEIARLADWMVCLSAPERFKAVGAHYLAFPQLTDADILSPLGQQAVLKEPRCEAAVGG